MEGPEQVKDSSANAEEPIKLEAPVQSPDNSDRSEGAASPPPNCSICLGKLVNTSFTDNCLHQFCFTCLLQWSKIKTECPLCKQTFKSIIHNVRSEEDYDQYHVPRLTSQIPQPQDMASFHMAFELDRDFDMSVRRFHYRTTMTGNRRPNHSSLLNQDQVARREQLPLALPAVPREQRLPRRAETARHRRNIYSRGLWSAALPDRFGRFRECSTDYYRREPRELNRLIPWLNRELEALLLTNSDPYNEDRNPFNAYLLNFILECLTQYDIRSTEFRDLMRPHLRGYTEHFAHELYTFARTNFDLVGYDECVSYIGQPEDRVRRPSSSSSSSDGTDNSDDSDDSSIRLLDDNIGANSGSLVPGFNVLPPITMPGPSTVAQALSMQTPGSAPDVSIVLSNTSSSDECEMIGYVKPRRERTPEIIELLSSDPEEVTPISSECSGSSYVTLLRSLSSSVTAETAQPSTSHPVKRGVSSVEERTSSTTESESDFDSDYSYRRSRCKGCRKGPTRKLSRRTSNAKRHDRSTEKRGRVRGSRNRSSSGESESRSRRSRRNTLRSAKVRLSSSSYTGSPEAETKKNGNDGRSRNDKRYSTRGSGRIGVPIKKENKYSGESSSNESSSEEEKLNANAVRRSRRDYISSCSDVDPGASGGWRLRSVVDTVIVRPPRQRSSSGSSYTSQKEKKTSSRSRDSQRYADYNEERNSTNNESVSKKQESKPKLKSEAGIGSSSDSEKDQFRSSSQCSNYSSKSHVRRKRSKHKDRRKSRERKRSSSKTFKSSQPSSSSAATSSASSKAETYSVPKHSDSSSSKRKRKSHKSHKESKHRKIDAESKSKSRKRSRRLRTSSSSNSE